MKFAALWVAGLALFAGPALAQKIYIDYDKDYDAASLKTFAWADTQENSLEQSNPLLHSRIVNGIEYYLTLAGASEAESDPDVYVTYHTSTKEELSVNTSHWGYGYPGGWAYGGYYGHYGYPYGGGLASTTVSTYQRGTLVVDVWDASTKQLVWRGTAADITVSENPGKMEKRIDTALKKMVSTWKKIKAKNAKG